jgi:hypothetical protein
MLLAGIQVFGMFAVIDGFVLTRCHGNLGGGALDSQGTIIFANIQFLNNSADLGGAVYNLGVTTTFEKCSIVQCYRNKRPVPIRHTGGGRYPGRFSGFRPETCRNDDLR